MQNFLSYTIISSCDPNLDISLDIKYSRLIFFYLFMFSAADLEVYSVQKAGKLHLETVTLDK